MLDLATVADWEADRRAAIVKSLRATVHLRNALVTRGSLESEMDLERVFAATADVGEFNRRHPDRCIGIADLIEIVPAIGMIG